MNHRVLYRPTGEAILLICDLYSGEMWRECLSVDHWRPVIGVNVKLSF